MYAALHPSRSEVVAIRSHDYHVRHWGTACPEQPLVVLVHGWMDVAASWQFVVDALAGTTLAERLICAPDWRGFGLSRERLVQVKHPSHYGQADHYWFADYLADLDQLIPQLNTQAGRPADAPVDLIGHSMGGNVAMLYAGIRPQRIRRLVNLEGFGMPASRPSQAPGRLAKWLDAVDEISRGALTLKTYDSLEGVARRLMKTNPRLGADKAMWLAQHWSAPNEQGQWEILGDPAHKVIHAHLYRVEEVLEVWTRISAPLLVVEAEDDSLAQWFRQGEYTRAEFHQRLQAVPHCQRHVVPDAGHMLHHDQPQALAQLLEDFLAT